MSVDQVLDELKGLQDLIEDEKEHLQNGLYVRLCEAMQKVYNHVHKLKSGGESDEDGDEDGDDDGEEVRMVYTPGGPYYVCSDGSHVRVWNNPHMLAQLAAGGAHNWRREREQRGAQGADRGRHGRQRALGAVGVAV